MCPRGASSSSTRRRRPLQTNEVPLSLMPETLSSCRRGAILAPLKELNSTPKNRSGSERRVCCKLFSDSQLLTGIHLKRRTIPLSLDTISLLWPLCPFPVWKKSSSSSRRCPAVTWIWRTLLEQTLNPLDIFFRQWFQRLFVLRCLWGDIFDRNWVSYRARSPQCWHGDYPMSPEGCWEIKSPTDFGIISMERSVLFPYSARGQNWNGFFFFFLRTFAAPSTAMQW